MPLYIPPPDRTDPGTTFRSLSPAARLTALVCGVVSPFRHDVPALARILQAAGIKVGGRHLTKARVQDAGEEVVRRGLAAGAPGAGTWLTAAPHWAPWLTMEASRNGTLEKIQAAHRQEREPDFGLDRQARASLELRCNAVAGRFDLIPDRVPAPDWRFLAQPGAAELLATLPERHRGQALAGCLREVIHHAAPAEPIIAACQTLAADLVPLAADIAFIRILQGRLAAAETVFEELPPHRGTSKSARTGRAAVRALVAMLRGDDETARSCIEAAVAAQAEGTKKRAAAPESAPFALSLLALVRRDTPADRVLLDGLLGGGRKAGAAPEILATVDYAAQLRAGQHGSFELFGEPGFSTLLQGLAGCWSRKHPKQHLPPDTEEAFARYVDRLVAGGFAWALAECLTVIGHPDMDLHPSRGRSPAAARQQATRMHAQLGTRTLADVVPETAAWEPPLKALEHLSFETRRQAAVRAKRTSPNGPRRLVWNLRGRYGRLVVTPREQYGSGSGRWSKGQARSLQWLAATAATAGDLLEQDRAAAAAVKRDQFNWRADELADMVLFELAGHPYVFNAAGDAVEVIRSKPGLVIDRHAGGVRARLVPDDWSVERYHAHLAGDRRCEVMELTGAHRQLHKVVPRGGLELPAEAGARLLEAAAGLVSVVHVHGGGVDGDIRSVPRVEADALPRVRLEPSAEGLAATLVVEPVAGSEIYFPPGTGGTLVFGFRNAEAVQARRDLQAERAAAERLEQACPRLAGMDPGQWSVRLPDPVGALELLEQLTAAGARCLWPHGERFKISGADTAQLRLQIKSVHEWLRASGRLVIDHQRALDLKQLFALLDANPGSRFLELTDGEFLSLTASFRRQLDDLRSLSSPAPGGELRLHPLAALALRDLVAQTQLDADPEWHALQQRLRAAQEFEPQVPGTLQAELRPYQQAGFRWLARLSRWGAGACLADDMGLGKTVQVLALLLERAPEGPALVVVPTSVVSNWLDEARRFAPGLNALACVGPDAARAAQLEQLGPFDVVITTYTLLHLDAERLGGIVWHSAVLDEAQAIKNPATKRARAARALNARFRLVTTGTPIQNNLTDLHSLFSFINPGLLGAREHFRHTFALPIEGGADADARARLRRLVAPFILRRLKTEVLDDLPARTEITLHVEMSPAEAAFYEALRLRAVEDLESQPAGGPDAAAADNRLRIVAHLMRLRRACCNPALVHRSAAPPSSKLAVFGETLVELLENRHKVLVFSQFVGHLKLIEAYLVQQGVAYQYLDGGTRAPARRARIAAFQAGQGDVFLISLTAGGVGLNLTAADYVIHMDPWWNPAVEDQASDRAHRIGQTRPVTIYRLVTKGTIEEQIVALHHHKRDLATRLLEASDAPGRLDAGELLALLRQPLA